MAVIRRALAVIGIAASVAAAPGVSQAAANRSYGFTVASVLPARGAVVGVAYPVVVRFSGPVADRRAAERTIEVRSAPPMTGRYEWVDNDVVQWVPDRYWPPHTTVALSVGGLSTEFHTGPKVLGVANISDHTFTVTIDGVEAGPPQSLPAPHHRPHLGEPGVLPASMGRPEYPTPVGSYTVLDKRRTVTMDSSSVGIPVDAPDGYRIPVDYAVRITNHGLYVHAAPWAVNAMGLDNVSHGCISLSPEDAEWYYNTVNVGDPVIVQEAAPESVQQPPQPQQPPRPQPPLLWEAPPS
ncbi:L,D-transpeptidase [Mycobacterium sp. Marseille-P9652]|uniref:L,D-transpeptidase n=1 Tax=Mycobacterium sp. Marseille-P9652 TaxID=2654950 RepID=UPI0012E9308C|nr:L,D-transpeptidase [Mycobacterium sp. Marseille-P9652]